MGTRCTCLACLACSIRARAQAGPCVRVLRVPQPCMAFTNPSPLSCACLLARRVQGHPQPRCGNGILRTCGQNHGPRTPIASAALCSWEARRKSGACALCPLVLGLFVGWRHASSPAVPPHASPAPQTGCVAARKPPCLRGCRFKRPWCEGPPVPLWCWSCVELSATSGARARLGCAGQRGLPRPNCDPRDGP